MAGLISELQTQHAGLLSVLDSARSLGGGSVETQELLRSARTSLLDHLRKEDTELYPVLRTAAAKDATIKETLDLFAADMAEISKLAIGFFKKCEQAGTGHDLAKDFGLLLAKLRSRIRREEELLYPLYQKLMTKKAA